MSIADKERVTKRNTASRAAATGKFTATPNHPKVVKHVAPAATVSEISEKLGITDQEIARVRKVLLKHGYLK